MTHQNVFIVRTSGENDAQPFDDILGVFAHWSDAKAKMTQDIEQLKKDWSNIDFNDPEEWDVTESDNCYEGFTPCDDYKYTISIIEMPIQ